MITLKTLIIFLMTVPAFADTSKPTLSFAAPVEISGESLGQYLYLYADDNKSESINTLPPSNDARWTPSESTVPNWWVYSGAMWGRLDIDNPGQGRIIYIEYRWAPGNYITLYQKKDGGQWVGETLGDKVSIKKRSIPHRYPIFQVRLQPGQNRFYFRTVTDDFVKMPLYAWSPKAFASASGIEYWLMGALHGVMIIMAGYNFFLYVKLRNREYMDYVLYIIFFGIFGATMQGLVMQYVPYLPQHWKTDKMILTAGLLTLFFSGRFSIHFLDLRTNLPVAYRNFRWIMAVAALSLSVMAFVPLGVMALITLITNLWFYSSVFTVGVVISMRRVKIGYYFVIAWTLLVVGDLIMVVDYVIPMASWAEWGALVGGAFECLLISLALGEKMSILKDQALEVKIENNRFKASMESAKAIQDALISAPKSGQKIELASHYQAAEETGGDWFSIYHIEQNNRLYVFIGDVSGHGLPAALVTGAIAGSIQTTIYSEHIQGLALEASLREIAFFADKIVRSVGSGNHMTMGFIAIDLSSFRMAYLNAGHPHIYISSEKNIWPAVVSGAPLGHLKAFDIKVFDVMPGDLLFFYTDGLLENTGPEGQQLKQRELRRLLEKLTSPAEVVAAVEGKTNQIWQGTPPADDCAYFSLKLVG